MLNANTNEMRKLQYHYCQVMKPTGFCVGSYTTSYEIEDDDLFAYIIVPHFSNDYMDKYYDFDTDLWYLDETHTIEATEVNAMYHG